MRSFVYLHCVDIEASRAFYTDLIGLNEIYFSPTDRSVGYLAGTLQLTVTESPDTPLPEPRFASQLGWSGGLATAPSIGFELPADEFAPAVERIANSSLQSFTTDPAWVGYWSFPVLDPTHHTVELSCTEQSAWSPQLSS